MSPLQPSTLLPLVVQFSNDEVESAESRNTVDMEGSGHADKAG